MKQMSDKDKKIVFYVIQQMKNGDIKFPSEEALDYSIGEIVDFINKTENKEIVIEIISTLIDMKKSHIYDNESIDRDTFIKIFNSFKLKEIIFDSVPVYDEYDGEYSDDIERFEFVCSLIAEMFLYSVYEYVTEYM